MQINTTTSTGVQARLFTQDVDLDVPLDGAVDVARTVALDLAA
jgi:hypothetical protein